MFCTDFCLLLGERASALGKTHALGHTFVYNILYILIRLDLFSGLTLT